MRILIVGSRGFIGSACYTYLSRQGGIELFGADVVAEYNDPNYFLIDPSNADYKDIFKHHRFDWCINCAGAASVPDSFVHPFRDYLLNVHLPVLLLNAIKDENGDCRLIQLSSAAVYGNPGSLPIREQDELAPLSPYGVHKKQAEELCRLYHEYFGVNAYLLRLFSAYGSGLRKQLFWDLYKKSVSAKDLTLFGTGKETREFIHVNDIASAIHSVIKSARPGFMVVNVANEQAVTIQEAAGVFLKYIGFTGKFTFNGVTRVGDPLYWQADATLLKSLGYRQKTSFEEGIQDYCKWVSGKE
jgi:dTDP-glucose 4,6-dehydratase/UDP-glucose 4-epimerase